MLLYLVVLYNIRNLTTIYCNNYSLGSSYKNGVSLKHAQGKTLDLVSWFFMAFAFNACLIKKKFTDWFIYEAFMILDTLSIYLQVINRFFIIIIYRCSTGWYSSNCVFNFKENTGNTR